MKIKITLSFIVIYVVFLVATAPANLINRFMPKHADIKFEDISGTLWNGKLSNLVYLNKYPLKELTWKIDWLALASLKVQANIEFNNGRRELLGVGSVAYGTAGAVVNNVNIDMQATELMPYIQMPVPVTPAGRLTLVVESGSLGDPYCGELDGYLVWRGAQVDTPMGNIDLASPNIDLSCAQGNLVASLKQTSEHLTTNANVTLKKGGSYQLQGNIIANEKLDPAIAQAISWIGPKNSKGETQFNYRGRL